MSIRPAFAERFGEDQAAAIVAAAESHRNGIHDRPGSDPFKWALCICIGYDCFVKPSFRSHHGITAPVDDLKKWIRDHGGLDTHDGDVDFLTVMSGHYAEYMPATSEEAVP